MAGKRPERARARRAPRTARGRGPYLWLPLESPAMVGSLALNAKPTARNDRARGSSQVESMIRLLALVPKPVGISPGQRYRLEQWAPWLRQAHGIDLDFAPFESPRLTEILYQPGRK